MSYQLQSNAMSSRILYIDSRDASNYLAQSSRLLPDGTYADLPLTSYFQYTLKEKIEVPTNQRALISLQGSTIPYSFYNIRKGINDEISIRLKNITSGVITQTHKLVIAEGNYTAYTFAEVFEEWLNGAVAQEPVYGMTFTFAMDFDTDKQKYKYTITKPDAAIAGDELEIIFQLSSVAAPNTPHIEMGFREGIDVVLNLPASLAGTASSGTFFSTNVIDMNGSIHGVYVRTNLVSNGTLDTQSGTFSNILGRIPIQVNAGGIIFAIPSNATHKSIVDIRSIDTLTIRLTDERNRILDLNGLHFQIAIAIDFIYAKRKINIPMGSLNSSKNGHSHVEDIRGKQEEFESNQEETELQTLINRFDRTTKINNSSKKQ